MKHSMKHLGWILAIGLSAAAAHGGIPQAASGPALDANNPRITPVVRAYQKIKPAVVNITTEQIVTARMGMGTDLFDDIFPTPFTRRVPVQSLGSGVVVHPGGYIVTNAHVVRRAEKIEVVFQDQTKYPARIISAEQQYDLAVLKIEPNDNKPLPYLPLGRSDDLMVGETVIAIGNPFGFSNSVSVGIVSATGRDLEFENGVKIASLIQTDAPINPGNSGGPLVNIYGELIGITTAIRADAQNIGFAIPVDTLAMELADLLDFERLNRAIFGASVGMRHGPQGPEVYVKAVRPGTPAEGQLAKDDQIASLNGQPVKQVPEYACAMLAAKPGDKVKLGIVRGGAAKDVEITLGTKPKPDGKALAERLLGLTLKPITPELAKDYRLPVDKGMVVVGIDAGSPAATVGLQLKDVLIQLDRFYVMSLEDLGTLLEDVKGDMVLRIGFIRGNIRVFTAIKTRNGEGKATTQPAAPAPAKPNTAGGEI